MQIGRFQQKEQAMVSRSTRRIATSLVVSFAIAGSFGPTAGAWSPEVDADEPRLTYGAIVVVPDAFERAAKQHAQRFQAATAVPDAFERAAKRGDQSRVSGDEASSTPPQS